MKKIFNHIGMVLSVALLGLAAACTPKEINELDAAGLSVKVFFPTKVVAGQPMTVNGTGMADVREVVFPGGVSVSNIEHVGNGMIRLTAPAGIASTGGKLVVRTSDDEAESKEDLTVGNTVVSGFSKMDGEELTGGEQLTVFGTDLEFICRAELFDTDGNPLILEDEVFYRKGTSTVILNIPEKILDGTWIGKLFTYDGKEINLPELNYKRGGGGHWETVKNVVWQNDGSVGEANWHRLVEQDLDRRRHPAWQRTAGRQRRRHLDPDGGSHQRSGARRPAVRAAPAVHRQRLRCAGDLLQRGAVGRWRRSLRNRRGCRLAERRFRRRSQLERHLPLLPGRPRPEPGRPPAGGARPGPAPTSSLATNCWPTTATAPGP